MKYLSYEKIKDIIKRTPEHNPKDRAEARLSFQISNRLDELIQKKCMTKKLLADAIGKKPSEITRWLSGAHNFTISTLSMLGTFFGEPIISVSDFN